MPLSSQNVMIHHGQTQEYMLKPKYFTAQKVISGEQSTEGVFPLRYAQDQVAAPFQCEYSPANHFSKFGNILGGLRWLYYVRVDKIEESLKNKQAHIGSYNNERHPGFLALSKGSVLGC